MHGRLPWPQIGIPVQQPHCSPWTQKPHPFLTPNSNRLANSTSSNPFNSNTLKAFSPWTISFKIFFSVFNIIAAKCPSLLLVVPVGSPCICTPISSSDSSLSTNCNRRHLNPLNSPRRMAISGNFAHNWRPQSIFK